MPTRADKAHTELVTAGGREQRLKAIFDARSKGAARDVEEAAREADAAAAEGAVTPVNDTVVGSGAPDYNPDNASVKEVLAFVEAHPETASTVLAAEKAGRNRKGVISALSG